MIGDTGMKGHTSCHFRVVLLYFVLLKIYGSIPVIYVFLL